MQDSSHEVRLIGEAALDWLSSGHGGKVLANVTHAVYLISEQDELLWLAPETSPMHRRCLRVPSPLPPLEAGTGYWIKDHHLIASSGEALDFGRSPVWMPPVSLDRKSVPVTWLVGLVPYAYHRLIAGQEPRGWGALIPAILQVAGGRPEPDVAGNGIILPGIVWPAVKWIVLSCLAHDFGLVLEHAAGLVGLGEGLTPSGDDFLGGLFFCLELLRSTYPEITDLRTWNYSDFVLGCKSQTNPISLALLKDHAEGHALEPLHHFADDLLAGRPVEQFLPFAGDLAAVGHSTGWDVLTGFLAGMTVSFPR